MMQVIHGPHFKKSYFKSPKCLGKSDNSLAILHLLRPPLAFQVAVQIILYHTTLFWGYENGPYNDILGQTLRVLEYSSKLNIDFVWALFNFIVSFFKGQFIFIEI